MLSFWERDHFLNYHHIVIGGGIVGLSTAVSIKEKKPDAKVLVLEKGVFPSGASTKNAGFSCFGSLTEILYDLTTMSGDEVLRLVELRWKGLQLLQQRLGSKAIDYHQYGGYELLSKDQVAAAEKMEEVNDLLYPLFQQTIYSSANDKISEFGFNKDRVNHLVYNPLEGQIHTGKMMKSLQHLAASFGVEVLTGVEVNEVNEYSDKVEVSCENGLKFECKNVAICTNAFSKKIIPDLPLEPGRGSVIVTKPITGLKFQGTFHYEEGYYYFRNYKDRVIFGGGRNLDVEAERTTEFGVREAVLQKLKDDLTDLILPGQAFEIEQVWSGIMAFGENKQPILKRRSERQFLGLRLGGMGVAIGSQLGLDLSQMMLADE